MKALPSQWLRLVGPYRNGDWFECLEILRPVVEQYPDDLDSRLLFGALCLATNQGARALVQFEKALPLAVGQGDLFRALGAQKQLDRLRAPHEKRFLAIHQWFRAIPSRRAGGTEDAKVTPAMLLELSPDAFHRVAEEASLEELGLETRELAGEADSVRVVLYGRVRWSMVPEGEISMLELVADDLDTIAPAPGLPPSTRLRIAPELPAACLRFDLALLREVGAKVGSATTQNGPAGLPASTSPAPAHAPGSPVVTASSGAALPSGVESPRAPATPRPDRPVPDPLLEPTTATTAPIDRRRETRASCSFQSRAALLGLAGSRVAPFAGRLVNLSPSGAGLAFARAEVMPLKESLEGTLLSLEIQLPDNEPPLKLMSRVRWVQLPPGAGASAEGTCIVGLEFILVGAQEHARIQQALIAATRAGEPLDPAASAPGPAADASAA